jgi:hypothetical protein
LLIALKCDLPVSNVELSAVQTRASYASTMQKKAEEASDCAAAAAADMQTELEKSRRETDAAQCEMGKLKAGLYTSLIHL